MPVQLEPVPGSHGPQQLPLIHTSCCGHCWNVKPLWPVPRAPECLAGLPLPHHSYFWAQLCGPCFGRSRLSAWQTQPNGRVRMRVYGDCRTLRHSEKTESVLPVCTPRRLHNGVWAVWPWGALVKPEAILPYGLPTHHLLARSSSSSGLWPGRGLE